MKGTQPYRLPTQSDGHHHRIPSDGYQWHQRHEGNHLLDCELQIRVVALITRLVGAEK